MQVQSEKRIYTRKINHLPIIYKDYDSDMLHDAMMLNYSGGGCFFVSPQELKPSTDIHINVKNETPDPFIPWGVNGYAEVRWCAEKNNNKKSSKLFGIGVQCVAYECSLCKEIILEGKIKKIDEFTCLCNKCNEYYKSLPVNRLKESIDNIMIGNII